jgi:hypothetical protein
MSSWQGYKIRVLGFSFVSVPIVLSKCVGPVQQTSLYNTIGQVDQSAIGIVGLVDQTAVSSPAGLVDQTTRYDTVG